MNSMANKPAARSTFLGRMFVHPLFDYMLIGGGLSLVVTFIVLRYERLQSVGNLMLEDKTLAPIYVSLPFVFLLSNSAHFAASTVRVYTKPGARESLPFLTMGFPLVCIMVLTLCISQAGRLGPHFMALYLTWSPYHYAAQAYGLAVMYSYRSGCMLAPGNKKLLWWVAMLPFFYAFVIQDVAGLAWIVPRSVLYGSEWIVWTRTATVVALTIVGLIAPFALYAKVWRSKSGRLPLISLLVVMTNAIWFYLLSPVNAFVWVTIFHGIQYLAIVIIFHVRDQMARADNHRGPLYHVLWFYGVCLLLGYGLFQLLPEAYALAGFGIVESALMVVVAINIHHFIVDAYIWRLGRKDSNRKIVDDMQVGAAQPTPA